MPRHKQTVLKPWLSANADNKEKRFTQTGASLLHSQAVKKLNYSSRWLYLCMANDAGTANCFEFSHSDAKKYGIATTTFDRSVKELCDNGFIVKVEDEERSQFKTNVFKFSCRWKSTH